MREHACRASNANTRVAKNTRPSVLESCTRDGCTQGRGGRARRKVERVTHGVE